MDSVLHVRAFKDNYIWVIPGASSERVAIVDPGDAEPVLAFVATHHLTPVAILCTHHHGDHVGGVADLTRRFDVPVYGPAHEHILNVNHPVGAGDTVQLEGLGLALEVLEVPGHTRGHIAYLGHGRLFCGDTLFSAGCGRLFEGTAAQMYDSLGRLNRLPGTTRVYCAHEYTEANLRFALAIEPENSAARTHQSHCAALRSQDLPTLPSTIGLEHRINPFLRTHESTVQRAAEKHAGRRLPTELDVFTELRRWKDTFRG